MGQGWQGAGGSAQGLADGLTQGATARLVLQIDPAAMVEVHAHVGRRLSVRQAAHLADPLADALPRGRQRGLDPRAAHLVDGHVLGADADGDDDGQGHGRDLGSDPGGGARLERGAGCATLPGPMLPGGALNLVELQALARERLSPMAYDYYASGALDERTLAANVKAWADVAVHYRVLVDVSRRDLSTTVLGAPVRDAGAGRADGVPPPGVPGG